MESIDFAALEQNIIDFIQEAMAKIGALPGPVSMNYPLDSLNALLGTDCTPETVVPVLRAFRDFARERLGEIKVRLVEGKYCLTVPAEGVGWVAEHAPPNPFLTELVALVAGSFGARRTIEDLLAVFRRYSDRVVCKEIAGEPEFNYLIFFADGKPDSYRYCIDLDPDHITYHRLTPHDYAAFGFEE